MVVERIAVEIDRSQVEIPLAVVDQMEAQWIVEVVLQMMAVAGVHVVEVRSTSAAEHMGYPAGVPLG